MRTITIPLNQSDPIKHILQESESYNVCSVEFENGTRHRLLIRDHQVYVRPRCSQKVLLRISSVSSFPVRLFCEKKLSQQDQQAHAIKKQKRMIHKYIQLARSATFTNSFIKQCCNANPVKSPLENGIGLGCSHEGQVITLNTLIQGMPVIERETLIQHLTDQTAYKSPSFVFNDTPCIISLKKKSTGFEGELTILHRRRPNKCYLLINDTNFIGYR